MGRDHQRRVLSAALVAISVALGAGNAAADPDEQTRERARQYYEQAEAHFAAKEFVAAAEAYAEAYALVPRPGLLFNIGLSRENAGQPAEAVDSYRRYLAAEPDGIKAAEARTRAEALERYLAEKREKPDDSKPDADPDVVPTPAPPARPRSWWPPAVAAGVAVALAGVGAIYALDARGVGSDLDAELDSGLPPLDSRDPRIDSGRRSALIANVAFAGAALATVAAAVLTARVLGDPARRDRDARAAASITGGPGLGAGVEVRW